MSNGVMVPVIKVPAPRTQGVKTLPEISQRLVIGRLSEILTVLEQIEVYCETGSVEGLRMTILYLWGPVGITDRQLVTFAIRVLNKLGEQLCEEALFSS